MIPGYFLRSARGGAGAARSASAGPDAAPSSGVAPAGGASSGAGAAQSGVVERDLERSGAGAAQSGVVERALCSLPRHDELTAPAALVGRVEQGIRFERLIAVGGMGAVYEVRLAATGQRVALKVLRREHAGDAGVTSRFVREVAFGRRIDHPNVCPVLSDGHLSDGRPFFLMPLYEGGTLGQEVRRRGPLTLDRALAILDEVLSGLSAMHAAGVVHRDLQPDNVLLTVEGGAAAVKLLDLGFSQPPGADIGDGVTRDSSGSLVGTVRFMSPEQVLRGRAVTERSDLFSAALLLYYALSAELPFRARRDVDVLVAILRAAPVPLRRLRRDAPRALDDVLARALAKHPDARFRSADEMRDALREIALIERAPRAQRRQARPLR